MTAYTRGEREFLEAMAIKTNVDIPLVDDEDAPESELAKKIRKHCKDNGLPCLIFPATKDLSKHIPKGWPDVSIFLKNRVIFFELKSAKGVLKNHQKLTAQMLIQLGYEWYLVRSYKSFIKALYSGK